MAATGAVISVRINLIALVAGAKRWTAGQQGDARPIERAWNQFGAISAASARIRTDPALRRSIPQVGTEIGS